MNFPEINIDDWLLISEDPLWIDFNSGIQKPAGRSFLYEKKTNKGSDFRQFLIWYDVYGRGVSAASWTLAEFRNGKAVGIKIVSQILKDGKWVSGILNQRVIFRMWIDGESGKFCGLKIRLQTAPNIFTEVCLRKCAGDPDAGK